MNSDQNFTMGKRWFMFAIVFFIAVTSTYTMFKAPPLFPQLIQELGFTETTIAWMMSMFAVIGVILAFPAGAIFQKLGTKGSLLLSAGSIALGSIIGALAPNTSVLLFSRVIEGIGLGMISVVGPAAVSTLIPQQRQGFAMGLYTIWFPLGAVIGLNVAPALSAMINWQAAWWFGAIVSIITLLLVVFFYQQPKQESPVQQENVTSKALKVNMLGIILLGIAFFTWNVGNAGAVASFYPSFLQDAHSMNPQAAGTTFSITNFLVLFLGPLSGIIADKLNTRKGLVLFALLGAAILYLFAFNENNIMLVYVFLVAMSLPAAAMPTGVFSLVPKLAARPEKVGLGMAIVAFFQNLGIMVGSTCFGILAPALGWNMSSLVFLATISFAGFIVMLFVKEPKGI